MCRYAIICVIYLSIGAKGQPPFFEMPCGNRKMKKELVLFAFPLGKVYLWHREN